MFSGKQTHQSPTSRLKIYCHRFHIKDNSLWLEWNLSSYFCGLISAQVTKCHSRCFIVYCEVSLLQCFVIFSFHEKHNTGGKWHRSLEHVEVSTTRLPNGSLLASVNSGALVALYTWKMSVSEKECHFNTVSCKGTSRHFWNSLPDESVGNIWLPSALTCHIEDLPASNHDSFLRAQWSVTAKQWNSCILAGLMQSSLLVLKMFLVVHIQPALVFPSAQTGSFVGKAGPTFYAPCTSRSNSQLHPVSLLHWSRTLGKEISSLSW